MNENIIKSSIIDISKIDKQNYLQSLINSAINLGIISAPQVEKIQIQLAGLLSHELNRYTHFESSSVKIQTAQEILCSIIYCVDCYLIQLKNADLALEVIKSDKLFDIYHKGLSYVKESVKKGRELYIKVKNNRIGVDMHAYNDTLDNAIEEFFIKYDTEFGAHEENASIDYPLGWDKIEDRGILYINEYLKRLYYENEFCRLFQKRDILKLLSQYSEIYNFSYQDMLINIFNLILINVCFCIIVQKDSKKIEITKKDCDIFQGKVKKGYDIKIEDFKSMFFREFNITDYPLSCYIDLCITEIFNQTMSFAKKGILKDFLVVKKEVVQKEKILFKDGTHMSNENFQAVVDEICSLKSGKLKAKIILNKVKSFDDLLDLLGAYCIFENEFFDIFKMLDDLTLAFFYKRLNPDLFFNNLSELYCEQLHNSQNETEWQSKFLEYLKTQSKEKYNNIISLAQKIDI